MRILVAEDSPGPRRLLVTRLTEWGYEAVVCADGAGALGQLQDADGPRLAILDWGMPGLSGPEVCREIRQRAAAPYRYLILLTGRDAKADVVGGLEAGADDYLTKPFDAHELECRVNAGRRIVELNGQLLAAHEALRLQAAQDSLTGVWNHGAIIELLDREISRAGRDGSRVSAIMADLDHFKRINDQFGHLAGDVVLCEAARRMASVLRVYDAIGRFGGEEFLIVSPGCDEWEARVVAERIRASVGQAAVVVGDARIPITLSLGVACSSDRPGSEGVALIRAADAALYEAKRRGRNRVEAAGDAAPAAELRA